MSNPILDVFNGDAFSTVELTKAINVIPNKYGLVNKLNIFKDRGVSNTAIAIERKENTLSVLGATERGAPGTENLRAKRDIVTLNIPHFQHHDKILAADLQNVRKFDTESDLESVQSAVQDSLEQMRAKHEITLEYMRSQALQGIVKDGDGTTLVNFFTAFGISQKSVAIKTSDANTNVDEKLRDIKRYLAKNLKGETMTGVLCLCSGNYFESIIHHKSIKDAYHAYQGITPYREDLREDFVFNGIHLVEYEGSASSTSGSELRFIPDNEAVFLPLGTQNVFETVFAPADYVEAVNTKGLPFYAKQQVLDFGKGVEIETQSNPLPICKRPDLLVKGTLN